MIRAVNDKVVAVMLKREKTSSGIIIPDAVQEPQAFCKIISIGEEVKNVEVGQIIVCHMRGGMDAVIDKQIIKILKADEIYGELTDEATIESLKEIELKPAQAKQQSRIVTPAQAAVNI